MPRFSVDHSKSVLAGYDAGKTARARASSLRVHFKNMREVAAALKGRDLRGAQRFLQDVLDRKQAVPFKKFTGGACVHEGILLFSVASSASPAPLPSRRASFFFFFFSVFSPLFRLVLLRLCPSLPAGGAP